MVAVDMSDYSGTMGQDRVGQMVLDTHNALGNGDHCQIMPYCPLLLAYKQPAAHETNISQPLQLTALHTFIQQV
jgi:hypothetical protein